MCCGVGETRPAPGCSFLDSLALREKPRWFTPLFFLLLSIVPGSDLGCGRERCPTQWQKGDCESRSRKGALTDDRQLLSSVLVLKLSASRTPFQVLCTAWRHVCCGLKTAILERLLTMDSFTVLPRPLISLLLSLLVNVSVL